MNITQVYLTPDCDTTKDRNFLVNYQNQTTYIQLFIEEFLRKNKVNLGTFNRIVFSEGGDKSRDFTIIGNNAMSISLDKTYNNLDSISSDRDAHLYYIRKYLEGFKKLDDNFSTSFVSGLTPLLLNNYKLYYEKEMTSKRIGDIKVKAVGRYSINSFQLIINVFKNGEPIRSHVVYECKPDMFISKYNVYRVDITDSAISVINKIRENTLVLQTSEFTN